MNSRFKMSTNRRNLYQIITLVTLYVTGVHSLSDITQNLLTPEKEDGEACGYESCPPTVDNVLNIHVVASTLGELGYTRTFDQHFTGRDEFYDTSNINMKRILDAVISELWKQPKRKFTFTDLPYLFRWWKIRNPTVHRMFYQLLRQGRIHLAGGGWSMTDESCNNYHTVIDHYTYSLRKLNETFLDCARPYVSWQADSFGHTGEFASIMAQMGFDGHFINPISYDDELARMEKKNLEFVWRGSPDLGSSSDIFTHKLFDGYWAPPGFCFGGQCEDPLIISTDSGFNNVEERVKLFLDAIHYRQAPHYATNHIMIVMGQRFGYYDAKMWFDNIDKLISGVFTYYKKLGYEVYPFYSTPICYLKAIYESNLTLKMESGDFVPVAYDKNTYFSGIFSSRPTVKYAIRVGHHYLQISRQLQVLGKLKKYNNFFEDFHWIVGVMADRNILSGGMRPYVRDYYIHKLYQSVTSSENVIKDAIRHLLKSPGNINYSRCRFNVSYCEHTDKDNYHIAIYNPLGWRVRIPVRLPCMTNSQYIVYGPHSNKIESAVMRIPTFIKQIEPKNEFLYELIFFAENVPPLGLHTYYIEKLNRKKRSTELFELDLTNDSNVKKDKDLRFKDMEIKVLSKSGKETANIMGKGIGTPYKVKESSDLFKTDTAFINEFKILNDIVIQIRKNSDAYRKNNATVFLFKKDKNKHSKRDIDDSQIGLEKISNLLNSILKNHKNATDSDKLTKLAKNFKKYLIYKYRINVLANENDRRLKESKKNNLKKDESYSQKKKRSKDGKKDTESKIYALKKVTMARYEENKNISKISLPIFEQDGLINNDLEKNIIVDNDKTIDQYVFALKELKELKRILLKLIHMKEYNKERNSTDEFTTEKKKKRNYGTKKFRKHWNYFKNSRLKRMTNEKNKLDIYNFNSHLYENDEFVPEITHDKNSFMPQNAYDDQDKFMENEGYHWLDIYGPIITTTNYDQDTVMPSINTNTNKTYASQDNMPNKIYERRDSNEIYATTEVLNMTSEEDVFTDKFDFRYRPQNSTFNFTFPIRYTNYNKKNIEFNPKITESPQDFETHSTRTTRPGRSLIKKIKNAKIKYLSRPTKNLKLDDGLLRNIYYEDDEDEGVPLEYDEDDNDLTEYDDTKVVAEHDAIVTTIRTTTVGTKRRLTRSTTATSTARIGPTISLTPTTTSTTSRPTRSKTTTSTTSRPTRSKTTTSTTSRPTRSKTTVVLSVTSVTGNPTRSTTIATTTSIPTKSTTVRSITSRPTRIKTTTSRIKKSMDYYIENEYINITLSSSRLISQVRLANGVAMSLNIDFYFYASDDPLKLCRPHEKKPGAYVFKTMDNTPMILDKKLKVEVLKSQLVEELHVTGRLISYVVRLYKGTPYFELTWICTEIPVEDGIGKDIFVRYQTDLDSRGIFYTDSNGRQTMKRRFGLRDYYIPTDPSDIPGNYYPVTSKISIEDVRKLIRFSVFNDRTQGGTSKDGNIDLMLNRRILTDDAGFQAFINETETVMGKHYFYLTKLTSKLNKIFEKKLEKELGLSPQVFVPNKVVEKHNWNGLIKSFKGLNKKLPIGLHILTLQAWNDGNLLLRIENYLELSDVIKSGVKKIVLKDLFSRFDIIGVKETTLGANMWLEDYVPLRWKVKNGATRNDLNSKEVDANDEIYFRPQQIRTFVIKVEYKKN